MIVQGQVWRTNDGRLVPSGDPDAAFLAFAAGQEVADREADRLGLSDYLKSRDKPQDKAITRPQDKGTTLPGKK